MSDFTLGVLAALADIALSVLVIGAIAIAIGCGVILYRWVHGL